MGTSSSSIISAESISSTRCAAAAVSAAGAGAGEVTRVTVIGGGTKSTRDACGGVGALLEPERDTITLNIAKTNEFYKNEHAGIERHSSGYPHLRHWLACACASIHITHIPKHT